MMPNAPVSFNRSVEDPPGKSQDETLSLANDSMGTEWFLPTIMREDGTSNGAAADERIGKGLRRELILHHQLPPNCEPGVVPFALEATLGVRSMTLRLPGIMVVPPVSTVGSTLPEGGPAPDGRGPGASAAPPSG